MIIRICFGPVQLCIVSLALLLTCTPLKAQGLLLAADHGGDGSAWGLQQCASCHPLRRIHRTDGAQNIQHIVRRKRYQSCTGCHGSNGTDAVRECTLCHNPNDLAGSPYSDGAHRHDFVQATGDRACIVCHQASDMNGVFDLNRDLTLFPDAERRLSKYYSSSDLCLRCHNRDHQPSGFEINDKVYRDPLVAMEDNYRFIDYHGNRKGGNGIYSGLRAGYRYASRVTCSDCHTMHGTNNPGLIIDNSSKGVTQLDPALGLKGIRIAVDDNAYAQLCVLCHRTDEPIEESENDTGNGVSGVHLSWGSCRECHAHGQADQAGL